MTFTFTATTKQIGHLSDVFLAISSINNQALMIITPTGITLYSELNHILNAMVTIDPSLFGTYNFYEDSDDEDEEYICQDEEEEEEKKEVKEELRLGVDIRLIGECFNSVAQVGYHAGAAGAPARAPTTVDGQDDSNAIRDQDKRLSTAVKCYITYSSEASGLVIEFEDSMVSEKIEFLTFYTDLVYPFDEQDSREACEQHLVINHQEVQFELILKSDVLLNLLRDLQQISTSELYLYISNEIKQLGRKSQFGGPQIVDNQVNFISKGPIGLLKLIFPIEKTILEKIEIFERGPDSVMVPIHLSIISVYNFAQFNKIFKSVKLSTKCKISKDLTGTLSVQLLCKNHKMPNYSGTLINFNMLALSGAGDDEDSGIGAGSDNLLVNLNNVFDNDSYEYVRDYNKNGEAKSIKEVASNSKRRRLDLSEYESIGVQIDRTMDEGRDEDSREGSEEVRGLIDIPLFL